jgi:hypothetical protein
MGRRGMISCSDVEKGRGGSHCKLRGPGGPLAGRGPDCFLYVFVVLDSIFICRLQQLTLSDQAQVSLQLTVRPADFV